MGREFILHKKEILELLSSTPQKIHLAFDIWTSRRNRAPNEVVAHFVCCKGVNRVALLSLKKTGDTHDGQSIAENVKRAIDSYKICEQGGYFVLNNASNNDSAIAELAKSLDFDPAHRRLRCAGHIINLIAKECLFGCDFEAFEIELLRTSMGTSMDIEKEMAAWRSKGPMGLLRNAIKWIRLSLGRLRRFILV